ncbi:MAG TPA: APC family permease [Vicinamibacteria bacterium]|nr:APC family permease [Vicinamibacteria bacterium]
MASRDSSGVRAIGSLLPESRAAEIRGAFKTRAGLLTLVGLLFASTCGGPYGMEDFVARVGPGLFITLLFVTPWLWGLPAAFASAELSSRQSVEGGYYRWARAHLGEFWGFQSGICSVLSSFLDNALYPVIFARAVAFVIPEMGAFERWAAASLFILALTWVNYRGIVVTGATAVVLNLFLLAPVVWIVIAGFSGARLSPFEPFHVGGTNFASDLGAALALALWLYSGYGEVSTVAEEIDRPQRNIPLGLLIVTPVVILTYSLPVVAGLVSVGGWESWRSGQFVAVGTELGGPALGRWAFFGSVASQAVIFLTYLLWMSRIAWSMAEDRNLPSWFSRLHPKYGTPYRVLWVYAIVYCAMAALPFEHLLVADIWVSGAYTMILHATLIRARSQASLNDGGFRVPGGPLGLWLNAIVPGITWVVFLILTFGEHGRFGIPLLLLGPVSFYVMQAVRKVRPVAAAQ